MMLAFTICSTSAVASVCTWRCLSHLTVQDRWSSFVSKLLRFDVIDCISQPRLTFVNGWGSSKS